MNFFIFIFFNFSKIMNLVEKFQSAELPEKQKLFIEFKQNLIKNQKENLPCLPLFLASLPPTESIRLAALDLLGPYQDLPNLSSKDQGQICVAIVQTLAVCVVDTSVLVVKKSIQSCSKVWPMLFRFM